MDTLQQEIKQMRTHVLLMKEQHHQHVEQTQHQLQLQNEEDKQNLISEYEVKMRMMKDKQEKVEQQRNDDTGERRDTKQRRYNFMEEVERREKAIAEALQTSKSKDRWIEPETLMYVLFIRLQC